jgi:hypothetical protein
MKQLAGVGSLLLGGTHVSGCLFESDTASQPGATPAAQSGSTTSTAPATQPPPAMPGPAPANSGPVWKSSPTIEFVEGVPAVISVRDFVEDPDRDPLVITMKSGALLPGITWNPSNATIGYDGRPLGAKPGAPVVVTGVTFSADDRKN